MPSPVSAFRASLAVAKAGSGAYGKVDAFEARTAKAELNKLQLTAGAKKVAAKFLAMISKKDERVAFLLLGKQAQEVASFVDTSKHAVVKTPHPSPLAIGNPFSRTRPYSAVNEALREGGRTPVDWTIPNR